MLRLTRIKNIDDYSGTRILVECYIYNENKKKNEILYHMEADLEYIPRFLTKRENIDEFAIDMVYKLLKYASVPVVITEDKQILGSVLYTPPAMTKWIN